MTTNLITVLTNAFSLNMMNIGLVADIRIVPLTDWQAAQICYIANIKGLFQNAIGHYDTDVVVRDLLANALDSRATNLPFGNRVSVEMTETTTIIVAQYKGPRIMEGATSLPNGAKIEFFQVQILPRNSVKLLQAAQEIYNNVIESIDSGETDCGGWPISGSYHLSGSMEAIGTWGPTLWESGIIFPNGMRYPSL